jgi:hypothetical protein
MQRMTSLKTKNTSEELGGSPYAGFMLKEI